VQDNMRAAWRLLFAGLATFALMGFGQSLFGPTLPEATRRFLLPEGEAALLVSAQWIGSAIGVATMFVLSHRIVPRHALALLTLGAAGLAAQPAWGAMLAASVVFGVGYGMATASFNPRVLKAFGDRGASMLSLLNAAFAAGAIVAPLVFVWLGSASALVFALMAGGCALVWVFAGEPSGTAATTAPVARTGLRPHWPILAFGAISVGIEASLIGLGPTALISAGVTEAHAAQYLSAFFLAFLAARVVLGFTAHRVTPFAIYLAAMVWAAACALAAAVWLSSFHSAAEVADEHAGYMPGFGNDFETEALPGALPQGMNSPQKCNYGLYGEQLSGTAFTAPSHQNERTWCYRIRPSVKHTHRFRKIDLPLWKSAPHRPRHHQPRPVPLGPGAACRRALTWLTGMRTMVTAGDVNTQVGMASHIYLVTESMKDEYFFSPTASCWWCRRRASCGSAPSWASSTSSRKEIAILPRGLVYRVEVLEGPARGFVCENYGQKFQLPGRGPIGANCMANRRDFKTPVAAFEDREAPSTVTVKWCGQFHETQIGHSPLDVVAWHGNYAPCKYDLRPIARSARSCSTTPIRRSSPC
jgi:MFS family permease